MLEEEPDCGEEGACISPGSTMIQSKAVHELSKAESMEARKAKVAAAVQDPAITAAVDTKTWYILGVTAYTTDVTCDSYAWVTVQPGSLTYKSKISKNTKGGGPDLHVYVPRSATSAKIEIYEDWHFDNHLFDVSVDITANPSWCDISTAETTGCTFNKQKDERRFSHIEWGWSGWTPTAKIVYKTHVLGSASGYLATGAYLEQQVDALSMRGHAVTYQDTSRTKSKFQQVRVKNDEVEHTMAFAKTGSAYPPELHGIFWMDQRGTNMPIPGHEDYQQVCSVAADEILVSFGQGTWDPATRCVNGLSVYGSGPFKGMWSWLDDTGSGSSAWAGEINSNAVYDFCYEGEEISVMAQTSVNSLFKAIFKRVLTPIDLVFGAPAFVSDVRMVKKPWGWDRHTIVAGPLSRLAKEAKKLIGQEWGGIMGAAGFEDPNFECHYPVFQIVDGDGQRTQWYDAYLRYVNNQTNCTKSAFDCPPNIGEKGTQFHGRLVAA